jgi:tRNA U38,U39,U40 pseudouridine synthase TruA
LLWYAGLKVRNFRREVLAATLEPAGVSCEGMTVLALYIKGTAFLWHQVGDVPVECAAAACCLLMKVTDHL